jgi:putative DNA primase/helicase
VVDPIGSYLGGGVDAHRDNEVRSVLAPVAQLAEKYGPAVLVVAHRKKGTGNNADDMALGSRGFTGIARSVWHLTTDEEDEDRRLLLPGKNNLAAQQQGLAFSISQEPARVVWGDPVDMSADEALASEGRASKSACDVAVEWLETKLANAPLPAITVKKDADAAGISPRTLARTRKKAGVDAKPNGFRGAWVWSLQQSTPRVCQEEDFGTL